MCKELQVHIFWFLVDAIITNAYILSRYSLVTSSMRSLKSFQLTLATQLIGNYYTRKRAGHPRSTRSMPHPPAPRHLLNMMALPPHTTIIVPLFICHLTRQKSDAFIARSTGPSVEGERQSGTAKTVKALQHSA